MRVVLLSPPYGEGPQMVMPLGMMSIAAYVNRQFPGEVTAEVYDFSSCDPDSADSLLSSLDWTDIQVVGFSVYSSHLGAVRRWAEEIKARHPRVTLIAGGPHPTLAWEHFVERFGSVFDAVVVGEGELPFASLISVVAAGGDLSTNEVPGVARNTPSGPRLNPVGETIDPGDWANPFEATVHTVGADTLTFTDHVTGRRRHAVAFTTSRSCPMRCFFCSIVATPDKYRSATPQQVVGWLTQEYDREPFEHAYVMDADFFTTRQRVLGFAEAMHAALPGMTWSTSSTVGHLLRLKNDLGRLFECGLRLVEMGMEAGSNDQLHFLGKKNFGKDATWQQSLEAVTALQQQNIAIGVDYIMFYPHQTLAQLAENLVFIRNASLLDEEDHNHYWTNLVLYPGTPLRDYYEELSAGPLTLDGLPDTDGMFIDQRVLRIKEAFLGTYRAGSWYRGEKLRDSLKERARSSTVPRFRAQLRMAELKLRHHPYRVLEALILGDGAPLDTAAPWIEAELDAAQQVLDCGEVFPPQSETPAVHEVPKAVSFA